MTDDIAAIQRGVLPHDWTWYAHLPKDHTWVITYQQRVIDGAVVWAYEVRVGPGDDMVFGLTIEAAVNAALGDET